MAKGTISLYVFVFTTFIVLFSWRLFSYCRYSVLGFL